VEERAPRDIGILEKSKLIPMAVIPVKLVLVAVIPVKQILVAAVPAMEKFKRIPKVLFPAIFMPTPTLTTVS
jgi:hypothetical protein